jgi:DNA-directed RNA polymerase subunit M/transcription elongation factor TFIIS
MENWVKYCFFAISGILGGYFIAFFLHETLALTILIAFFALLGVVFLVFMLNADQATNRKSAQDAFITEIKNTITSHEKNLERGLKKGTDYLTTAGDEYHLRVQNYFERQSSYKGFIRYHIYAAALRKLHQTRNAEKAEIFINTELEILKKIETGQNVLALCREREDAEERAYKTLLGRVQKGTLEPKTAFYKCKNCGAETKTCLNCGGELEHSFKH